MLSRLGKLWSDESGQATVEYGVVLAVIAVAAIAILNVFWEQIATLFEGIATSLETGPVDPTGG